MLNLRAHTLKVHLNLHISLCGFVFLLMFVCVGARDVSVCKVMQHYILYVTRPLNHVITCGSMRVRNL